MIISASNIRDYILITIITITILIAITIIIIIIIIIIISCKYFIPALADCFHWSPSHNISLQVSITHLSILAKLNNALVWRV